MLYALLSGLRSFSRPPFVAAVGGTDWILATGFWDDTKHWDDTASWID